MTLYVCACQVSQQAQSNIDSNRATSDVNINSNSFNEKPQNGVNVKPVDDSRFAATTIKKTIDKPQFFVNVNVQYPQLVSPRNPQEKQFNAYVKKQVDDQISDFVSFLQNKNQYKKLKEIKNKKIQDEYEINLDYKVDYFSNDFTSILMYWNGYSGYLNMDYFPSTINFDLKNGSPLRLADLFKPQTKYLNKMSEKSRAILKRTCLTCGCGSGLKAGDRLPDDMVKAADEHNRNAKNDANSQISYQDSLFFNAGTEAKEVNYRNWSITPEGLKIIFNEYQVGPGCIGIIDIVIPFADLQPIFDKRLKF